MPDRSIAFAPPTLRRRPPPIVDDPASSIAAFVGPTGAGPLDGATPVRSVADYVATFGPIDPASATAIAVALYFANGGTAAIVVRVADATAVVGDGASGTGLHALDAVAFGLLVVPGIADAATLAGAVAYAAARDALLLIDPPADAQSPADLAQRVRSGAIPASPDAALYFPWLSVAASSASTTAPSTLAPPAGALAGRFASNDAARGIWTAPAITTALVGVTGPAVALSTADLATLAAVGVNTVRRLPVGVVPWGARTLAGPSDAQWRYVPVRRMALHLERSIRAGLRWTATRPFAAPLWADVRAMVGDYLGGLFRRGAFQGARDEQAWFVQCDATTMTSADVASGNLVVLVGFAPLVAAEFVVLRIADFGGA